MWSAPEKMEAMTVGFEESMDMDVISQGPQFIDYCVKRLDEYGVPVITPGGGLGAHIDVKEFLPHVPQSEYSAGALSCALYICGGIWGMEPDEIMYMGDDVPDLEPMTHVGMPVCPADAAMEVIGISRYVSQFNGGAGCVRDVVEQVMRARGDWYKLGDEPIPVASR